MDNIFLEKRCVDLGYPDPGHDEWFLVKTTPRKIKFLQTILGNRKETLICYGEDKPMGIRINKDISDYLSSSGIQV